MNEIHATVPTTIICSKAVEDIKDTLDKVQTEHGLPSDLMVMICRDILAHFERKRANEYCNAIIKQTAQNDALNEEIKALKEMTGFLKGVADDHTKT